MAAVTTHSDQDVSQVPSLTTRAADVLSKWAVLGGFALMVGFFWASRPDTFGTWTNFNNLLSQAAVPWMFVAGLSLMLIVNEFDLAFPQAASLAGAVTVILAAQHGWDYRLAIVVGLLAACSVGALSGFIVSRFGCSSFISTLGVGAVATGVELALTENQTIYQDVPQGFAALTSHRLGDINITVILALVISLGALFLARRTTFGRHAHAIGSNADAAYLAGIPVQRVRFITFLIMAGIAGIAGITLMSRASSFYPNATPGYLLSAYAAVFLGAAVLKVNRFNVLGSLLGVMWVVVLQNGLTIMNQPAWISSFVQGALLLVAIVLATRGRTT